MGGAELQGYDVGFGSENGMDEFCDNGTTLVMILYAS
jgi:hypothetical protein